MGPTELLVLNFMQDVVRLSFVGFALVCVVLSYLTLQMKKGNENSAELTLAKGEYKIQVAKVGPFIVFVLMACGCLYQACSVNLSRQMATQSYHMNASYTPTGAPEPALIPPPGVPVRPDDHPAGNQRGR